MKKYLVAVLLMICILFSVNAGGGSQSGAAAGPSGGPVVKPDKITWLAGTVLLSWEDGLQLLVDKYKEMTGITLEILLPAHNQYFERVDLAFATGEAPDVVYMDAEYRQRYGANGALYDITPSFEKHPYSQYFNKTVIEGMKVNGKLYGLPLGNGNGTVTYYRSDWLAELGMQPPKNYNEFIEMLRAFKRLYPDKIPYTAPGIIYDEYPIFIYTQEFFQDARPDYVKINGKWVDGFQQPNMRAALERFRTVFAEGLVDRELVTNTTSTARDKIFADMCGVMNYWAGPWNQNFNDRLKATNPKGQMDPLPAIQEVTYIDRVSQGNTISRTSKNPEGVFEWFLMWMYDHGPGQMLWTHGIEGVHYKMEGGQLIKLPSLSNPANTLSSGVYLKPDLNANNWTDDPYKLAAALVNSQKILYQRCVIAELTPPSSSNQRNGADIQIARKKFCADVVYGIATFDQAFQTYKNSVGSIVDQVLADFNR